jgi:hypothetical protein
MLWNGSTADRATESLGAPTHAGVLSRLRRDGAQERGEGGRKPLSASSWRTAAAQSLAISITRKSPAGVHRPSCSPKMRRAGLRPTLRSCRSYCGGLLRSHSRRGHDLRRDRISVRFGYSAALRTCSTVYAKNLKPSGSYSYSAADNND